MGKLIHKLFFALLMIVYCYALFAQKEHVYTDTLFAKEELQIKKLNSNINSKLDEYWPTITADGEKLFFTRKSSGTIKQEDFFVSEKKENEWQKAYPLITINTHENEGAQSITADGRFFVFTACNRRGGFGSCDLYYTIKVGEYWTKPVNMGKTINTSYWETQPSLSADGKKLYFVSNRKGGKGKMDIWVTHFLGIDKLGNIVWATPQNLNINTEKNELSPFIHHNGKDLYFASNGYNGYGGLDLYLTHKEENDIFSTPKNLGNNINSSTDELGFVVTIDGEIAYFSTSLKNDTDKDIYRLKVPMIFKPAPTTLYRKGKILNQYSKVPVFAQFTLINKNNKRDIQNYFSDIKTGEYIICMNKGNEYLLYVSADGFMYYAESFDTRDTNFMNEPKNIVLTPISIGEKVILKHIYFNFDSYTLNPTSFIELNNIVNFLKTNTNIHLLITGHTDNRGTAKYNMKLSEQRAKSVYDYLVTNGVDKSRLSYKGFGLQNPISSNKTPQAREKNRRTEIVIVKHSNK